MGMPDLMGQTDLQVEEGIRNRSFPDCACV